MPEKLDLLPNGRAFTRLGLSAKPHARVTQILRVSRSLFQPREDEDIAHFAFARDSVLLKPWLEVDLIADGHISPHVRSVWSARNAEKRYHSGSVALVSPNSQTMRSSRACFSSLIKFSSKPPGQSGRTEPVALTPRPGTRDLPPVAFFQTGYSFR
jgi:hypothetical protein